MKDHSNIPTHEVGHDDVGDPNERISIDEVIQDEDRPADTTVPMTDNTEYVDENSDAPPAGTPGWTVDEDTA